MWARKAYDVLRAAGVGEANETGKGVQSKVCDAALGATLFNLGMLREVGLPWPRIIFLMLTRVSILPLQLSNDPQSSHAYYTRTLKHYSSLTHTVHGQQEGIDEAQKGLTRLGNVQAGEG